MSNGRQPPHNIEAEQSVLGSLLLDPDAVLNVSPFLRPDDFYRQSHAAIYQAILNLHDRRQPADVVTLSDELTRQGQLEEVGGEAYVTSLINAVPNPLYVEHYGRIVERVAVLRRLISAAGEIAGLAYEESEDVEEVVDRAEQVIFGVAQRRVERDLVPIQKTLDEYYERIEYLYEHRGETIGLPTGFIDLDKLLAGLQPADLIIVAGRPGMGKTSLALTMAENIARRGKAVALFSLEMPAEQVVQRLVSSATGLESPRLRSGDIREQDLAKVLEAMGELSKMRVYIDDTPAISPLELRAKARRHHAEHGLDLVIVDYLQLMRAGIRAENRVQEVSYISRQLKSLARELKVPLLAVSQLSRAVELRHDKLPVLSDLRESGSIEQDADVVIFIYREVAGEDESERANVADIMIAKHRNGPTGKLQLVFLKSQTKFVDALVDRRAKAPARS